MKSWEELYNERKAYHKHLCGGLCEQCTSYIAQFENIPYDVYEDFKEYCQRKQEEEEKCSKFEQAN